MIPYKEIQAARGGEHGFYSEFLEKGENYEQQ